MVHLRAAHLGDPGRAARRPAAPVGQRRLPPAQHRRDDHGGGAAGAGPHGARRSRRTPRDPAVQVVANPLVLLDRLPTRESARLVLEMLEQPQNLLTYQMGVWLATQKMVRGEFTPAERTELHMLVLRAWRSDAAQASEDLAELIVDLPDGMRATLVQAAVKAGRPQARATSSSTARRSSRPRRRRSPRRWPRRPARGRRSRRRTPRTGCWRGWCARRCSTATPSGGTARRCCSAPPRSPASAADALLARLNERSDPAWLRVRLATLVRYLCDDSHRLRMLPLVGDPVESVAVPVIQGLGHLSFSPISDQQVRASWLPEWSPASGPSSTPSA